MFKNYVALCFFALLFHASRSSAQIGGTGVFKFLNSPNSAKVAALGNGLPISLDAELDQAFGNPSLISKYHQNAVSLNYSNYVSDIYFGNAQYGLKLKADRTLALGVTFVNYGEFDGYDATGTSTENTFTAGDYLLNIGYAENWKNKVFVGANLKLIYGAYDIYNSFAIATDIAVSYKDSSSNFASSFILKNIGYQLNEFDQQREPLPFQIAIGLSKKLEFAPIRYHITYNNLQKFDLTYRNPADADDNSGFEPTSKTPNFINKFSRHIILGTEVLLSNSFNLQAGYNFQQNKELSFDGLGGLAGFSFGFSLHLKRLSFGYAHSKLNIAGSNNYFSLNLNPSFLNFKN